jgi:hypothetical protein
MAPPALVFQCNDVVWLYHESALYSHALFPLSFRLWSGLARIERSLSFVLRFALLEFFARNGHDAIQKILEGVVFGRRGRFFH